MPRHITTPSSEEPDPTLKVLDALKRNIRHIKADRGMSDAAIASAGGYSSRQLLNHRLSGRTIPDIDDITRIAAALKVAPVVLFLPLREVIEWIDSNPEYQPPGLLPRLTHRDVRNR